MRESLRLHLSASGDREQHKQSVNRCMSGLMGGCTDDECVEGWRLIRLMGAYDEHGARPPECCVTSAGCIHARSANARAVWREGIPFFPLGILPPEDQEKLARGASGAGLPAEYRNAIVFMCTNRSDRRRQQAFEVAEAAALTVLSSGDETPVHNRLRWLDLWTNPDIGLDTHERLHVAAEALGRPATLPDPIDMMQETLVLSAALAMWAGTLKSLEGSGMDAKDLLIRTWGSAWRDKSTRRAARYAAAASSSQAVYERCFLRALPRAIPP